MINKAECEQNTNLMSGVCLPIVRRLDSMVFAEFRILNC